MQEKKKVEQWGEEVHHKSISNHFFYALFSFINHQSDNLLYYSDSFTVLSYLDFIARSLTEATRQKIT